MNRFDTVLVFLCMFCVASATAQQNKPVITFTEKEYDFGTFTESQGVVTHDFSFMNSGNAPIIISEVKASCGCTTPEYPKEPILPGKKATIRVRYDPTNRPGSFDKTIVVKSNADIPTVTLAIRGVVIPVQRVEDVYKFTVGPLRVETIYASFGEIYKGDTAKSVIRVMNISKDEPVRLSFRQLPPYLKVSVVPEEIGPNQEGSIVFRYITSLSNDWDFVVDRIELLINGQAVPNNRFALTANIRENFRNLTAEDLARAPVVQFDQTKFDFDTVLAGKIVEHSFTLSNTGQSVLIIRKVAASCGCTAVRPDRLTIAPGGSTQIKAVFNSTGREGNQKKAITIITNDPKRYKTILWVTGVVADQVKQASQP